MDALFAPRGRRAPAGQRFLCFASGCALLLCSSALHRRRRTAGLLSVVTGSCEAEKARGTGWGEAQGLFADCSSARRPRASLTTRPVSSEQQPPLNFITTVVLPLPQLPWLPPEAHSWRIPAGAGGCREHDTNEAGSILASASWCCRHSLLPSSLRGGRSPPGPPPAQDLRLQRREQILPRAAARKPCGASGCGCAPG